MATRTIITLVDDIDGKEGAETVRFSLQTTAYEIDVTSKNRDKLFAALSPFIEKGRKVPRKYASKS